MGLPYVPISWGGWLGVNWSAYMAVPCVVSARQDGRLEYTEFIAAAMDQRLHQNEALCWRAFKAFDRDLFGLFCVFCLMS